MFTCNDPDSFLRHFPRARRPLWPTLRQLYLLYTFVFRGSRKVLDFSQQNTHFLERVALFETLIRIDKLKDR